MPAGNGRRILGVDAGGTGTRAVLVVDGSVVERYDTGPLNILLHPDSSARLATLIAESGADLAGLGLAGVLSVEDVALVTDSLKSVTAVPIAVSDDSEVALLGALGGKPGIVVIAGTGSIGCGRDESGRVLRVGGHGFLLGDDGGGYWIGRECLRAALRAHDGTGPVTALSDVVCKAFGTDLHEAIRRIHGSPTNRELLTGLVPLAAGIDDEVAADVFSRAAAHLIELAQVLRARLGPLPCAMVGGVFSIDAISTAFAAATGAVRPIGPPELGAVRLAELTLTKEMARS